VLCTIPRPHSQESMVGARESPSATDGDEVRVAVFGEDHGCNLVFVKDRVRGVEGVAGIAFHLTFTCVTRSDGGCVAIVSGHQAMRSRELTPGGE
jgi:hypothetical protein